MSFMPGFRAATPPFSSWSLVAVTSGSRGTGGSLSAPDGLASANPGDLAVFVHGASATGGTITITEPSGFSADLYNTFKARGRLKISSKILTYSDISGGDVTGTISGASGISSDGGLYVFRPNYPLISVAASGQQSQGAGGDPSSQTISAPTKPAIVLGVAWAESTAPTCTGTLVSNGSSNVLRTLVIGVHEIQNSSFASRTFDCNDPNPSDQNTVLASLIYEGT